MIKKITTILALSLIYGGFSLANYGLTQCKVLLEETKGTEKQQIAEQTCGVGKNTEKKIKTKMIGKIPHWTDTAIKTGDVNKILSDSIIAGNPKARYIIIEYSDIQCPFCKKHRNDGTLNNVLQKYNGNVSKTFRHFPLEFHQYADIAAFASQCVAKIDRSKYYEFIGAIFKQGLSSEKVIHDAASQLKIDEITLTECMSDLTIKESVAKQILEGINLFGITGTPGHVILDTKTGKYKTIIGAHPSSEFESLLNRIIR